MALQAKYPFLETLSESEAISRGANLDDKINYTVFHTIKDHSTQESVRSGKYFTLDTFVPDILNLTKADLSAVVRKLIVDRLVIQIFRMEYESTRSEMQMVPCFLAQPGGEHDTTFSLWVESNSRSVTEIEKMLSSRPPFDRKLFAADLAQDLKSEKIPPVEELKHVLVDFFQGVHPGSFEIVPPADLIPSTLAEIRDEITRRKIAVEIPDYGFMPLGGSDQVPLFELAGRFLTSKILPRYKNRGNLKGELERVLLEEERYAEEERPRTTEFIVARASALKKEALSGPRPEGMGARFPGSLTTEIIQKLAPLASSEYETAWNDRNETALREIVDGMNEGTAWHQVIRFMTEEDLRQIPPVARDKLLGGGHLYHETFMRGDAEVHVFVRRDGAAFRLLVDGMRGLPAFQQWQILAMKVVLEKNEMELANLFDDPEFVRAYGKLLREVYMRYFPWYIRLLFALGLSMFQDQGFKVAKQKIQAEQKSLRDRYTRRKAVRDKEQEEERKKAALRVRDRALSNTLIETLDHFYLEEHRVPTVDEVRSEIDMSSSEFDDIMNRGKFQKVKLSDGGQILLYPLDHNWRSRVARLRRTLDLIREAIEEDVGDSLSERVRKLEKHLTATESAKPESSEADDPYGRFSKAVKDYDAKNKEPLDLDFSDDLEV